jgi:hypothetical protein
VCVCVMMMYAMDAGYGNGNAVHGDSMGRQVRKVCA